MDLSIDLIRLMHRRVAQVAIGPSSLRNQGAPGVVACCRQYFEKRIRLERFANALKNEKAYARWLDRHTNALVATLPKGAQRWGAARKALNLFLRDVCYNTVLAQEVGLPRKLKAFNTAIHWLELPLDKEVAQGMRNRCRDLPRWTGIRHVTPEESREYQVAALKWANRLHTARVHLDLALWGSVTK
jgi:hypothetical protein